MYIRSRHIHGGGFLRCREIGIDADRIRQLIASALHDFIRNGGNHRHLSNLSPCLHRAECSLHADLHRLSVGQSLFYVQFARFVLICQIGAYALLDLGGVFLGRCSADSLDDILLERHIHQRDHERQSRGLILSRQALDCLRHRVELLASVA